MKRSKLKVGIIVGQSNKKRATIRDVAKVADVSVATVSRYLNGKTKKMTAQTAAKIAEAIEKLRYVPNSAAREMSNNSSKIIAVLVANLNDYFSIEAFKGASQVLEKKGYVPVLLNSGADTEHEKQLLQSINIHGFDGLIFQPLSNDRNAIKAKLTRDFPLVILDRELDRSQWPQVITDNHRATVNTCEYFINQGFTHIVVLSSTISEASTRQERYNAIKETSSNVDLVEIDENHFNRQKTFAQLKEALAGNEKSVLFSLKERWLLEFLPQLMKEKVIQDGQQAVTGFADTSLIKSICPYAKVISQDPFYMGQQAADILLKMLTSQESIPGNVIISAQLKK
jgi:LacI family kdg operon repressor